MTTRAIIDYALDGDAINMRNELYGDIHDRVMAHIESKKQEIAHGMVAQEATTYEIEHSYEEPSVAEGVVTEAPTFHVVFHVKHGGKTHKIPTKDVDAPHSPAHINRHVPGLKPHETRQISQHIKGIIGEEIKK